MKQIIRSRCVGAPACLRITHLKFVDFSRDQNYSPYNHGYVEQTQVFLETCSK